MRLTIIFLMLTVWLTQAKSEMVYTSPLNYDIETIYPYNNYLFLGSKTGLYIYAIDKTAAPVQIGQASHAHACDPVVANDSVVIYNPESTGNCGPMVAAFISRY